MEIEYPINDLLSEIVSDSNLYESYDYVVSHLDTEEQRSKYRPPQKRAKIVEALKYEIGHGIFRITQNDVEDKKVKDGPKERICQAPKGCETHRMPCRNGCL